MIFYTHLSDAYPMMQLNDSALYVYYGMSKKATKQNIDLPL